MATTTTYAPTKGATATLTISPENVASSSTFVAGVESAAVTLSATDYELTGLWTSGTTPTANTQVQVWAIFPVTDDGAGTYTWPDVFDGTASAETATSAGVLQSFGELLAVINVDSNTSNRAYHFRAPSLAAACGGRIKMGACVFFITHNTGVNSNTTAGNFKLYATAITDVWTTA